jgi:hypothetical protein
MSGIISVQAKVNEIQRKLSRGDFDSADVDTLNRLLREILALDSPSAMVQEHKAGVLAELGRLIAQKNEDKRHQGRMDQAKNLHDEQLRKIQGLYDKSSDDDSVRHSETKRVAWFAVWASVLGAIATIATFGLGFWAGAPAKKEPASPPPASTLQPAPQPTISTNVMSSNSLSVPKALLPAPIQPTNKLALTNNQAVQTNQSKP